MMKTFHVAFAAVVTAATLGFLPSANAHASAPSPAIPSGSYVADPVHTQINFSVMHFGFAHYSGVFSDVTAHLALNATDPSKSRLDVSLPVGSVLTTSAVLNGRLKNDQWFDIAKYPLAKFVSRSIKMTGPKSALITGELSLHGVTHTQTLRAHFVGAGVNPLNKKYTVGFEATGTVKRSLYGLDTYLPAVGDNVKLMITAEFTQQN